MVNKYDKLLRTNSFSSQEKEQVNFTNCREPIYPNSVKLDKENVNSNHKMNSQKRRNPFKMKKDAKNQKEYLDYLYSNYRSLKQKSIINSSQNKSLDNSANSSLDKSYNKAISELKSMISNV